MQYTRGNPWQTARVALAGPILGGVAVARLLPGRARRRAPTCSSRSRYFGFFLNLINLIPIGILDGGAIWRSAQVACASAAAASKAVIVYVLYVATASRSSSGWSPSHVPRSRVS